MQRLVIASIWLWWAWLVPATALADSPAITVTDDLGRQVSLPQPARRVVALAPHLVENIYSAGGAAALVASVDYADYPAAARDLPRVGGIHAYSLEAIASLKPDLILTWATGEGRAGLTALSALGAPVYASEPQTLSAIAREVRNLGLLLGTGAKGEAAATEFESTIRALRRPPQAKPLKIFYQVWDKPLQTIGGKQLISEVMELCGGRNVFADSPSLAPKVSIEGVLALDPDAIVASGMDESRPEWLDHWRAYPRLSAVRRKALIHVHPDLLQRPTLRIAQGATQLCEALNR